MNEEDNGHPKSYILQLEKMNINFGKIERNLPIATLIEIAIQRNEGLLSNSGALSVKTGKFTGRSPDDKFIVDDEITHDIVDWGKVNHPIASEKFDNIFERMKQHVSGKDFFIFDGFVGADPESRLPIRVFTDNAWYNIFASQIFIRPKPEELDNHKPEFTLFFVNDFASLPEIDGTKSGTFIIINFSKKMVLIGYTSYAGEIKKAMFSVMNFLLPRRGIFPMHCSANMGKNGETALFFGLSGTGKTTLSADPERYLIGDDEHGWSDRGIFNFEGGCYAKCINLKKEHEPQIWNAIKFGSVMENVTVDELTREPNFEDSYLTENTRVVYPLEFIPGAVIPSVATHPRVVIFLTADAFGVMPPVARLTKGGAMYHFISGYTSKLAGTERGITEPKETFSQCFGAPFMPLPPVEYAKMLASKISEHNTSVYLINTGWTGGPYGIGRRMDLKYTRAMVSASLNGDLQKVQYKHDSIFNLDIPLSCPQVPSKILDPSFSWSNNEQYIVAAKRLAHLFIENFKRFGEETKDLAKFGPQI
ncbi:MAG: phosphoenolpyruvate carboxykinase (ATP) [Nitrososphaeraceae archaeon]|nr:phosphoenolpyruvate carboxykinase (ATP) [Nitrososphaeraceae archaeon]MDW0194746.1 phosphoenolpyruvate carboxykinase (ATP) [Nitrososphaeraceae archaeon]MDW0244165.1 phosphoenolpyruvate carboxykinase (ATP) [Nitrososphaeraceae archaeon]MDW0275671.1 phosphoenolpyruvate carboxykinase (ATP) [Nitrososphaeraceae archaeon]MDW0293129.1 phosphoenolpyruvate carboxykinase (ATP) [Nitrososphaeraceae archaeon]